MKARLYLLIFSIFLIQAGIAQVNFFNQKPAKSILSKSDSILSESLPELLLPDACKRLEIPYKHDNSHSPFLRPIFNQNGACCGQASGVGYNFTYEINRARDLHADTSINQYPAHFTWNFMNGGDGFYGVSYFHSWEIIKTLGNPNVVDYGSMDLDEGIEWMTGYEKYYNSMHNRIRRVYKIKADTEEGLLTLKHWLHNHLVGSETGGIANYYAGSPWALKNLPPESPEAGKRVIVNFEGSQATHAMTIVGYDDSIRWDYNLDGQFTNDLDINGDGLVNMKDWEIGAFKFANSYGVSWADSGFCYLMYKVIADDLVDGGIWNHTVHVLDVKADYEPLLTMKFTIKHDSREKIKITAGVSKDTSSMKPDHILDFPVFDYQGGHQYMQGERQDELKKYLEAGLDITPLLSYINPGEPAKFFLLINEHDPLNEGTGRLIDFSLMDYTSGITEIPGAAHDVQIVENGLTRISIVYAPDFDKVKITTDELPVAEAGINYQAQLEAQNGKEPYQWQILTPFYQQRFDTPLPEINDEQLFPASPNLKYAVQKLEFEFPFYGEKFDSVYVHQNGYIMFAPDLLPWPYFNDPYLLFKKEKNISAFLFSTLEYHNDPLKEQSEMWYEGNQNYAAFRWNGPLFYFENEIGQGEYAVILYPDGKVDFFYNEIEVDEDIIWYSGVSAGDEVDFTFLKNSGSINVPGISSFRLIPEIPPSTIQINEGGLLTGTPEISEKIYNITFKVTDDNSISSTKSLQFSDGLIFSYSILSGDDTLVQNGENVFIDLFIKNIFEETFHNITAELIINDPFLEPINTSVSVGDLTSGESLNLENALEVKVLEGCPNQYAFLNTIHFNADEAEWNGLITFEALSPEITFSKFQVEDDNNNRLDPGETAGIFIELSNLGMIDVNNVQVMMSTNDDYITINEPNHSYGNLLPGETKGMLFSVTADQSTPILHSVVFEVHAGFDPDYLTSKTFTITIGQNTALVINKSSIPNSSQAIYTSLQEIGATVVSTSSFPAELSEYRSVFVCLGTIYSNSALSAEQGAQLADYLNGGGNVYLEGTMTWVNDPQTNVQPMFNAGAAANPWASFEQLTGVDGTFTEGMDFEFSGLYNLLPCLMNPVAPAFPIFYADGNAAKCVATAYDAGTYKTVGAIHQFGNMGDEGNLNERNEYMRQIMEFFELGDFITRIPENAELSDNDITIDAFPNPFRKETKLLVNLKKEAIVNIEVFDLSGQKLIRLSQNEFLGSGIRGFSWNGTDSYGRIVPPGIYIYQVKSGSFIHTGKLIRMD